MNRLYEELALDFETDFADFRHVNILGAIKCTNYIGGILKERISPSGRADSSEWDRALSDYLQEENAAVRAMKEYMSYEE